MRGVHRLAALAGMALSVVVVAPATAGASQTIGQIGNTSSCTDDEAYLQKTLVSGPAYSPSAYGVITSWSAMSKAGAGQTVTLMVFQSDGSDQYSAVATDSVVRTLSPIDGTVNTFSGVRIPIEANQTMGVYQPAGSTEACEISTGDGDNTGYSVPFDVGQPGLNTPFDYSGTDFGHRINARALVEPDADRDGFGDETQDQCPTDASTQGPCPAAPVTPVTPVTHKKKCKKHKKKNKSAAAAKKKHCKKKK
jgi:hypothetical protein